MAKQKTRPATAQQAKPIQANQPKTNPLESFYTLAQKALPAIFIIYVLAIIVGVIRHESWADEAQSWLLVKDLSLAELFKVLPSEGHPPLWYLILFPFAKLGAPYTIVKWIAAAIMCTAIYLLLFKTKVHILLKLAIPFSVYYFYQYALFGRSYPLIALFTACAVVLYPKRFEKPWPFALCMIGMFNTHMHYFCFTFCLACLYLVDAIQLKQLNKKVLAAFIVMMIGGLYLVPYISSSPVVEYSEKATVDHWKNISLLLEYGLIPFNESAIIGALFAAAIVLSLVTRPKVLFLLLGGMAGYIYIVGFRYNLIQPRHYGVMVLIIVGTFLFADFYRNDKLNLLLKGKTDLTKYGYMLCIIMLVCQLHVSFQCYGYDKDQMYSCSKDVAEFLIDNKLEHNVIVGCMPYAAISVIPYLPDDVRFYDAGCKRWYRHYVYDDCFINQKKPNPQGAVQTAWEEFYHKGREDVLLICNFQVTKIPEYLDLVYVSPQMALYGQETFFIYKFNERARRQ